MCANGSRSMMKWIENNNNSFTFKRYDLKADDKSFLRGSALCLIAPIRGSRLDADAIKTVEIACHRRISPGKRSCTMHERESAKTAKRP